MDINAECLLNMNKEIQASGKIMPPLLGKGLKLGTAGSGVVMFPVQIPDGPQEFPGGPVVRAWGFHSWGLGSLSGWGTKDPATCTVRQKGKERVWTPPGVAKAGARERLSVVSVHLQGQVCDPWLGDSRGCEVHLQCCLAGNILICSR